MFRRLLVVVVAAAAAAFFAYAIASRWSQLHSDGLRFQPAYLVLATFCISVAVAGVAYVWKEILHQLEPEREQRMLPLMRAFFYSWLARYVPGTVPFVLMRIEMTQRLGYKRSSVAASIVYENVLQVGLALVVSLVLLFAVLGQRLGHFSLYGLALIPLALAAASAHPRVLIPAVNRIARRLGRPEIDATSVLTVRAMARATGLYTVCVLVNGLGFYFALLALTPAGPEHIAGAIGTYNLAAAISVLVIFVPSGLGVREGVIVGLMSLQFPVEVAAGVAVLSRVAAVAADGLPAAAIFAVDAARRLRR